jgi:uncharacterized protein DUF6166
MRELGGTADLPLRARPAHRAEGMTHTYSGTRRPNGMTHVSVNGRPLEPRTDLRRESTTTFDWGYVGQGAPAQLALAILADHLGDDHRAQRYYEHFLRSVVRVLPSQSWLLTGAEIDEVLPAGGY